MRGWRNGFVFGLVTAALCVPAAVWSADDETDDVSAYVAEAGEGDAPLSAEEEVAPEGAAPPAARPTGIEEITVTARKREELLQSTPISMVAFGKDELEGRQITRITDVGEAVPNLKFDTNSGSNNQTRIFIRGVGQDDGRSNVDPGVGLYIDGVYVPRANGSVVSTLDVEAIEVLRGPQGTLFGKNTVGGVVAVKTARPGAEFDADALVRVGSLGLVETQAMLNVPLLSDRVFARMSVETQTDDGYQRNRTQDSRTGDNKLLKGRFLLRMVPTEEMTIDLTYEQTVENEKTPTPECRIGNPFAPGRFLTDNFAVGPNGERFTDSCSDDRGDDSPFTASANFETKNDLDTQFAITDVSWDLGTSTTFRSISSWRRVAQRTSNLDLDATATDGFGVATMRDTNDTFSQEFQLNGAALDDAFTYTLGAYWFKEKGHGKNKISSLSNVLAAIRAGTTDQLFFPGSNISFQAIDDGAANGALTDGVFGLNQSGTDKFETTSLAGFLEGTLDVTNKLSLTAGIRYTTERKERQGKTIPLADAVLFAARPDRAGNTLGLPVNDRFGKWTPRFQVEYQATDEIFAYASYSRGYKSGGFNTTVLSPTPRQIGGPLDDPGKFDEEILDAYEIGIKTQWLENRLVVNLAAFYNDYDDIQLSTIQIREDGRPQINVNNVAKAVIRGWELDFQYRPIPELTFSGGVGMTDVDYRDFIARVDTATALRAQPNINFDNCESFSLANCDVLTFLLATQFVFSPGELPTADFSDEDRTNTPNFNGNLSAEYVLDMGGLGQLVARTTFFMQGDVEYTTFNTDVRQSKYGLLNGRLTWELADGNTTISLAGRNLLDRNYINGGFSLDDTNGVSTVFRGRPRTFSVEVRRRF